MYGKEAKEVLKIEAEAIEALMRRIDEKFDKAIGLLNECRGRVIVTGMGKGGLIGQKISATLSSTGTPSLFLHSAEAIHGDLGRVTREDVILAISNSGETEEVIRLLPLIKKIGARLIALTGNPRSTLGRHSDVTLDVSVKKEACPLGLAPTASTTATLAMGDAIAVCLLKKKGFREEDFAFYHPGGALGKRLLLKVEDIMRRGASNPVVKEDELVRDVLLKITEARAGAASVVDRSGKLTGIFTDGDLRRHVESDKNLVVRKVKDVMTKDPVTIPKDHLASEALRILQDKRIDEVPIVDARHRPIGMLDVQDLLKAGLV
ncbi:MAG: KpsF/GutQ family sugar-phosphate isomerase [Candidatus Omnitrophota bacterium]|jgi:arabinose-5-phosphate isomerase|nr:KpsF/GutQ family sugar-phosphate isomerase [Candidatus Omnitrophota bacterium]MDD5137779.1 KpsF/GutQ family sugar-phosphate isomerase [Candidatus Omnitrophota bacterium]MDD5538520.1 KpsF/GutQ family sugar-phosphate isomerase [Candidatus Omnitrophota bacterium]